MAVSYLKLWKLLVDKQMTKTELKEAARISTNVLAKLGKSEPVSMYSLEKICIVLSCDIGEIMEILPNKLDINAAEDDLIEQIEIFDDSYKALGKIDWSFSNCKQDAISLLHPYPARFIEELPRQLINALGCPQGTVILDPFCGSGTTLVEAQRVNTPAIGIDLNPIACLISRTKTATLEDDFLSTSNSITINANERYKNEYIAIPSIPNLDHWFKMDVQKALSAIMSEILASDTSNATKDALSFALSSIIVRVSNQESDTRYAAIEKNVAAEDVFHSFSSACKKLAIAKQETSFTTPITIFNRDVLKIRSEEISHNVGLVITSPPYPNAYEYWLYHKYRMWWLGYDPIAVRSYEIGARPHYQKKNGQTEKDFSREMGQVFELFNDCVVPNGHVCIIIGRSIIKGRYVDNAAIITEVATRNGYVSIAKIPREIAQTRKSFNLSYGKITTESILIFRR